jgi:diguanylate cyclase (GGDEF)-like protein
VIPAHDGTGCACNKTPWKATVFDNPAGALIQAEPAERMDVNRASGRLRAVIVFSLANSLVIAGAALLVLSLLPIRRLIAQLPASRVRHSWYVLTALIVSFIAGYFAYFVAKWNGRVALPDLVVPGVFFLGGCYVALVNMLSLRTALDMRRLAKLEHESVTDPLTGIYNRRYLEPRLADEIARASRYHAPLSVLLIDVDRFKRVNDEHGHQAGDVVLKGLARLIVQTVRVTDIVARYGGEEIIVLAPSTSRKTARSLAERLRAKIETASFPVPDQAGGNIGALRVTVSIGVACLGPDARDARTLIRRADEALYEAKGAGRNRVAVDDGAEASA